MQQHIEHAAGADGERDLNGRAVEAQPPAAHDDVARENRRERQPGVTAARRAGPSPTPWPTSMGRIRLVGGSPVSSAMTRWGNGGAHGISPQTSAISKP